MFLSSSDRVQVAKDITMDDLNEDDLAALKSGHHSFLPGTDAAGRLIYVSVSKYAVNVSPESQV